MYLEGKEDGLIGCVGGCVVVVVGGGFVGNDTTVFDHPNGGEVTPAQFFDDYVSVFLDDKNRGNSKL